MNNRNVATKEIFSVLDSKHDSVSDVGTQPELSEHSGWQLRGFGGKKTKQTKTNEKKQNSKHLRLNKK